MIKFLKKLLEIICMLVEVFGVIILLSYPVYFFVRLIKSVKSLNEFFILNTQGLIVVFVTLTIVSLANYIATKLR